MRIIQSAVYGTNLYENSVTQKVIAASGDASVLAARMQAAGGVDLQGQVYEIDRRQTERTVLNKEVLVSGTSSGYFGEQIDQKSDERLKLTQLQAGPQVAAQAAFWQSQLSLVEQEQRSLVELSGFALSDAGERITFRLSLKLEGYYFAQEELFGFFADPLIVNYAAPSATLSAERFEFDLQADGRKTAVAAPGEGSAFLARDRNQDGIINDGSELFGALSGDGFAELSAHDSDKNGWIDANDPVYESLFLWIKNSEEDRLVSLKEAGIAALSLTAFDSPYALRDIEAGLLGQIRQSAVFLKSDGDAGLIQQVDLFQTDRMGGDAGLFSVIASPGVIAQLQPIGDQRGPRKNEKGEWTTNLTFLKIEKRSEAELLSQYRHASKIYESAGTAAALSQNETKAAAERTQLGERLRALEGELMRTESSGVGDETKIRRLQGEIAQTRQRVSAVEFRALTVRGIALKLSG